MIVPRGGERRVLCFALNYLAPDIQILEELLTAD